MSELGKPLPKKSDEKNKKKQKIKVKMPHVNCEQKFTSGKAKFRSNTVFSLYFKIGVKKFHAAKPLAFLLLPVSA